MAETIYLKEATGYDTFCIDGGGFNTSIKELDILQKDIQNNGGSVVCYSGSNSYCAGIKLFGPLGGKEFFCIDDEGRFETTDNQACGNENTSCP